MPDSTHRNIRLNQEECLRKKTVAQRRSSTSWNRKCIWLLAEWLRITEGKCNQFWGRTRQQFNNTSIQLNKLCTVIIPWFYLWQTVISLWLCKYILIQVTFFIACIAGRSSAAKKHAWFKKKKKFIEDDKELLRFTVSQITRQHFSQFPATCTVNQGIIDLWQRQKEGCNRIRVRLSTEEDCSVMG